MTPKPLPPKPTTPQPTHVCSLDLNRLTAAGYEVTYSQMINQVHIYAPPKNARDPINVDLSISHNSLPRDVITKMQDVALEAARSAAHRVLALHILAAP